MLSEFSGLLLGVKGFVLLRLTGFLFFAGALFVLLCLLPFDDLPMGCCFLFVVFLHLKDDFLFCCASYTAN